MSLNYTTKQHRDCFLNKYTATCDKIPLRRVSVGHRSVRAASMVLGGETVSSIAKALNTSTSTIRELIGSLVIFAIINDLIDYDENDHQTHRKTLITNKDKFKPIIERLSS